MVLILQINALCFSYIEQAVIWLQVIFRKMIATCLVQGSEPPTCFASAVADYLVFGRVESAVDLDDIPDFKVRNCLHKVSMLFITFIFTMYTSHCLFSLPLSYYSITVTYIIVYYFAII